MTKHVLKLLLFSLLNLVLVDTSYSQAVEVIGFIPNKGQFSGKGVLGQFSGANTIFYLTDTGISFEFAILDNQEDYLYKIPAKHHIKVLGSTSISFDSIELYDSSSNTLNYYLPHCKHGVLDVRAYERIVIKSILPGIDWEIKYTTDITNPFVHRFRRLNPETAKTIVLQIEADRSLDTIIYDGNGDYYDRFHMNTIITLNDTLRINNYYYHNLLALDINTVYQGKWLPQALTWQQYIKDSDDVKDVSALVWNVDWFTRYNLNSTLYITKPNYFNALDFAESSTDISRIANAATDNKGNYYVVGASILNAQERSEKDSLNYYTEAFISKFDTNSKLLWTTFYGSSLSDIATGIAINSKNDIYLSGHINLHPLKDDLQKMSLDPSYKPTLWKNDFPTKRHNNDSYFDTIGSLFLLKLDTNGKRQWATLIGKDYGEIEDKGKKRSYMIDCEFFTSAVSSKDDIYFSGTYRPSLFRNNANDELPSIVIREKAMGLPIRGDANTTWTMEKINAAAPDRFLGTNQWNVYPFILKLDSNDNLVWSTYFFTTQPIAGMAIDSKDNLYIGGNSIEGGLPVKRKEGAFYKGESFFKEDNLDLPILEMERRAYIAEFDKNNKLTWCTYLENEIDKDRNTITAINDIDIGIYDNLLLTGYTTNTKFPLQRKGNAYFEERDKESPTQNTFIMEFDGNSNLQWSTLYILDTSYIFDYSYHPIKKVNSWGLDIEAVLDGSISLALSLSASDTINKYNYNRDVSYYGGLRILEFDKTYNLESNNNASTFFFEFGNKILDIDIVIDSFSFEKYDNYKDVKRLYNLPYSSISLDYSPTGRAYLSGASSLSIFYMGVSENEAVSFGPWVLVKHDETTFVSGTYPYYLYGKLSLETISNQGFIKSRSLCKNVGNLNSPLKDSILCVSGEINLPLSIDTTAFTQQHNLSWYRNNKEVSTAGDYTITEGGVYHFVVKNITYPACPSFYSDTMSIVADTIDLNFREDTIPLCVGADYTLSAYSLEATYLWSDSTTDSTYIVRYNGDSIDIIWCQVKNDCGGKDSDSVVVRFYPPYAYLGKDTLLCRGDSLNFDASILNKSIPAVLEYRWILNGDIIDGTGANKELFTITEKDSGQLILHAIWPGSGCEVGIDTLNFAYYQFDNVDFYLPTDTSICFYDNLELDLIQTLEPNTDTNNIYLCLNSKGDTISQKSRFILKDTLIYYISASNYCSTQKDTLKLSYFNNFNIEMLQPTDTLICKELFPTEIPALTTEQIDGKCYWLSENKEDTIEIAPSRYINQDGTYPITLSDIYNCSQDYEITVGLREDCDPIIDLPNVFTPNSDGVNDFFKIISANNVKDFDIVIFNKAGTKVYEYEGLIENFAWNGCYKNSARDVPEGAYFFVILYKDITNATRKQAGTLTLLR